MANLTKIYSDLDLTFTKRPVVGDVALKYDTQAVLNSIRNLVSTNHYERLFNPDLGSNIQALLFENMTPMVSSSLEREITNLIETYEPRVKLHKVSVIANESKNTYEVSVTFFIENATQATTATLLLERVR